MSIEPNIFKWPEIDAEHKAQIDMILSAASAYYSIIVSTVPSGYARVECVNRLIECTLWALKATLNPEIPR